jgi:hypothetical protein
MGKPRFGHGTQCAHSDPETEAFGDGNAILKPFDSEAGAKGRDAVRSQGASAHGCCLLRKEPTAIKC